MVYIQNVPPAVPGGIGLSAHRNCYQPGVLVGNWTEARLDSSGNAACNTLGGSGPFQGASTTRTAYCAQGKTGAELAAACKREDVERTYACTPAHLLLTHGEAGKPPLTAFSTLSQLTLGGGAEGSRKVQACLWTGRTASDARVPTQTLATQLLSRKRAEWQAERMPRAYVTTTREVAEATVQLARGVDTRRTKALPQADGGQPAQIGRKAKGEFAEVFDKTYQRIGLRSRR